MSDSRDPTPSEPVDQDKKIHIKSNPIDAETTEFGMKELNNLDDWYLEGEWEHLKIWSKTLFEKYDISAFKAKMLLKRPVDLCLRAFRDHESRVEYVEYITVAKKIDEGEEWDICYQVSAPPLFFLSPRDSVLARTWSKSGDGYDIITKSVEHPDYPLNDLYTRAEIIFQAVQLRPSEENPEWTDIVAINQMNSKFL